MALFPARITVSFLMVLLIPFSLFLAILFRVIKHQATSESIHFILFVAAIITQILFLI